MQVFHGSSQSRASEKRGPTFSGPVWADPVLPAQDNVSVAHVFFQPGSRTFWHVHERGQVLHVTAGRGWVCTEGGQPQSIGQGDVVWIRPGERHWHGAASGTMMAHLAISLGKADWQEELPEAQYALAGR